MTEPYAAQDALIDAALAAGEKDDGAVKTCPKCRCSWTAPVPVEACDCDG